jgi:hypothetical protein
LFQAQIPALGFRTFFVISAEKKKKHRRKFINSERTAAFWHENLPKFFKTIGEAKRDRGMAQQEQNNREEIGTENGTVISNNVSILKKVGMVLGISTTSYHAYSRIGSFDSAWSIFSGQSECILKSFKPKPALVY